MSGVSDLVKDVRLPNMVRVRQSFDRRMIMDVPKELKGLFSRPAILDSVRPGMVVAVAVGSRGITGIAMIVKETIEFLKARGAIPYVVPAMGSHGGASAEGQIAILAEYGITESLIGAPIKSSMDVVELHVFEDGMRAYCDRHANAADAIVIVNRIKRHTCFTGRYESGLMKMMAIGLGKQKGASSYHEMGFGGFAENVERVGLKFLEKKNVAFGIGILENAYTDICKLSVLTGAEIPAHEPALLEESRTLLPRIYFDNLDVLVVDWIGKNISGDGMDPNITGAFLTPYSSGGIKTKRIAVLDLTRESYGNACGAGVADTSTRRLFEKIDFEKTYPNSLTSTIPLVSKIPMIFKNQKEAIQAAVLMASGSDKARLRIVRISDTLHIDTIYVSESMVEEAQGNVNAEVIGDAVEFSFDEDGNLF